MVQIVGHTDADGDERENQQLSERRAQSLASEIGPLLPGLTIEALGRGESEPLYPNDTPENKAGNRRVEFRIIAAPEFCRLP